MLFLGMGWMLAGNSIPHIFFGEATAKSIGWVSNGFQYEVGFASLGIGLAGLGLALRDSHPGFDPLQAIERYDEDSDFAETEQY